MQNVAREYSDARNQYGGLLQQQDLVQAPGTEQFLAFRAVSGSQLYELLGTTSSQSDGSARAAQNQTAPAWARGMYVVLARVLRAKRGDFRSLRAVTASRSTHGCFFRCSRKLSGGSVELFFSQRSVGLES